MTPGSLPECGGVQHQPDQKVFVQRAWFLRQRDAGADHVRGLHQGDDDDDHDNDNDDDRQGNQGQLRELDLPWLGVRG